MEIHISTNNNSVFIDTTERNSRIDFAEQKRSTPAEDEQKERAATRATLECYQERAEEEKRDNEQCKHIAVYLDIYPVKGEMFVSAVGPVWLPFEETGWLALKSINGVENFIQQLTERLQEPYLRAEPLRIEEDSQDKTRPTFGPSTSELWSEEYPSFTVTARSGELTLDVEPMHNQTEEESRALLASILRRDKIALPRLLELGVYTKPLLKASCDAMKRAKVKKRSPLDSR